MQRDTQRSNRPTDQLARLINHIEGPEGRLPNASIVMTDAELEQPRGEGRASTPPAPAANSSRPSTATIRAQCQTIAAAAEPEDSYRTLAQKVETLSERQVQRRIEAMERELGMQPAERAELGGGRRPLDGSSVRHAGPYRRAGAVARTWRRRCTEDCL